MLPSEVPSPVSDWDGEGVSWKIEKGTIWGKKHDFLVYRQSLFLEYGRIWREKNVSYESLSCFMTWMARKYP